MKSSTTKTKVRRKRKSASVALSTCPVNGAGWCPYPFSPAQLEKKLKAQAEKAQAAKTSK